MNPTDHTIGLCLGLIVLLVAFAWLALAYLKLKAIPQSTIPAPQIIVNMPADARPLAQLAPVEVNAEISGQRAVLWWTVYAKTVETDYEGSAEAITAADAAVLAAYGPL